MKRLSLPPLRSEVTQVVLLFLITRIVLILFAGLAAFLVPRDERVRPADPHINVSWLRIWSQWDVGGFLVIADKGYSPKDPDRSAFFPFFPLLIRAARLAVPNTFLAGLLVSNLAMLLACLFLFWLTKEIYGNSGIAHRAVFYLLIFPASFYTFTVYSESTFLATSIASFYLMARRRWLWAGVAGGMAAATRAFGVSLLVPFATEYLISRWKQRSIDWGILGGLLIPLGLALVSLMMWLQLGDPWGFIAGQRSIALRQLAAPWQVLWHSFEVALGRYLTPGFEENYATNIINLASALFAIALIVPVYRRLGASYTLYVALSLLLPLSFTTFGDRPLLGMVRYVAVLFPLFMVLAEWGEDPKVDRIVTFTFLLFFALMTALFVRSWNVAGVS